jgi:hypothetical protein
MRKAGANLQTIADELGISVPSVHNSIKRYIERINKYSEQEAVELRRLQLERLDTMLLGIWDKAQSGGLRAIDRVVKIETRRAKLLGLDEPEKRDITTGGEPLIPHDAVVLTQEQLRQLPDDAIQAIRSLLASAALDNDA